MAIPRNLLQTTPTDILALVQEATAEGPHIDFKRDLPGRDNRATHELVADVSAFANGSGGDLVYGIDEDGAGCATTLVAQTGNADEEVRRIKDVLMTNVEPRMPGVQVHAVPVDGGFVLIIRVPQSWAGPHRVKTNQHFFIREGSRKRPLDVPEVRGLFLRSEAQAQRVRDFRTDRLGKLLAGTPPVRLQPGAYEVVHLIPTDAALGMMAVDPVPYSTGPRQLPVLGTTMPSARLNLDGALVVRGTDNQGRTHGYSQFFRVGYFETIYVHTHTGNGTTLGSTSYEHNLIQLIDRFRIELTHLGHGTEMTCMWSLIGADKVALGLSRERFWSLDEHQGRFDREVLALPDVLLPAEVSAAVALRPLFDLVWQSAGMERSLNYDEAGNWVGRIS